MGLEGAGNYGGWEYGGRMRSEMRVGDLKGGGKASWIRGCFLYVGRVWVVGWGYGCIL